MLQYNPSISGSLSITGSLIISNGMIGTVNGVDVQIFSSSINQVITGIQAATGSQEGRLSSIESFTSSIYNTNTFTSSTSTRLTSIETISASNIARLNSLEIKTGSLATTGSNTFIGTQTITGSLYISSDLIVQGTSSLQNITASAVSIGTNIVNLNTANPAIRYAGLVIGDSGSVGGSGSFLYDSVQDEMIFVHRGTSTVVTSSVTLMGPQTFDNVGNETYPTANYIQKGTGNEHLVDSCIVDTNGSVSINGTLCTSGIICSNKLEVWQSTNNRLVIDCVNTANQPRISSLDSANNPQYLTINSYDLKINSNGGEALRINDTKQFIVGATSMAYANTIGYVAGFMSDFTGQSVVSIARKGQTLASQGMFIGIDSTSSYFWNRDNVAIQLGTNDTTKMTIACTGQAIFACSVCAPQYITTQGSSVSYASGTNYTIWNSEAESCIQDSNNPAAYTRIKTWIADRSGCATIRFNGYIQSGPTYWGYRVTRNGSSSYMCVAYSACVQPGCPSANVHGYSNYEFNVGPFLPGDCIGLDVVSTGGGATPSVGQGQWIYAKEFRVLSTTPNFSAGTSGNVFGEWVGIGTCTPFSNLYINGNNPAVYDATVDNGQDGCGVTLTVRNNSTTTNSFSQLNLQVSGDSGRAVGRIALIRTASATGDMAFITEDGNTKSEKMRITSCGKVGIGAISPKWLLEICCNTTNTGGGGYPAISINNPNDAGYSAYYFFKGTNNFGGMEISNATCHIFINSLNTFAIQANGVERLRVNQNGGFGTQLCNFCLTNTYQTLVTIENGSYGLMMLSSCLGGGTYALYNVFNNAGVTSANLIHGNNIPVQISGNAIQVRSTNGATYCDMRSSYIRFY